MSVLVAEGTDLGEKTGAPTRSIVPLQHPPPTSTDNLIGKVFVDEEFSDAVDTFVEVFAYKDIPDAGDIIVRGFCCRSRNFRI